RRIVLETEPQVTRTGPPASGQLARHPDRAELALERSFDPPRELRNGVDARSPTESDPHHVADPRPRLGSGSRPSCARASFAALALPAAACSPRVPPSATLSRPPRPKTKSWVGT